MLITVQKLTLTAIETPYRWFLFVLCKFDRINILISVKLAKG